VALLKIQRTMDRTVVFTVSGRLDAENVGELCQLVDAEPAGAVVVLDLTDLVLADRDAVRYLRDYETDGRIVLHNMPSL
jgi:anti-anti-sigma regulatory factor